MSDALALRDPSRPTGDGVEERSGGSLLHCASDLPYPTGQGLRLSPLLKLLKKRTVVKPAAGYTVCNS